ncbi:MAG: hypothetical protein BJ554DRAFT_4307 [Olpidium bornovanus]|uniref:Uncharacterized protein n=1 Tax=Olpidium bornovanus TaxID=278681 RepID=A0A8H7ZMX4_9FUNG|nr:MAG: hypothetical protein BJ554DRAFT_4307 [Olpidium bornovanus]
MVEKAIFCYRPTVSSRTHGCQGSSPRTGTCLHSVHKARSELEADPGAIAAGEELTEAAVNLREKADVPAADADHVDKKRGLANAPPSAAATSPVEGGPRTTANVEIPTSNEIAAPRGDAALRSPASGNSLVLAQPREPMETEASTNGEQPAKDTKRQKLLHISNITGALSSGASQRSQGSASLRSQASSGSQQPPMPGPAPKVQGPHTSQSPATSQRSQPLSTPLPLNPSVLIACTGYLTSLKRWNRQVLEAGRESKASSAEARELVDLVQLELQNLRYECWHFEREIDKCESFK